MCYNEREREMRIRYNLPEMYEDSQYRTIGQFLWRPLLIGNEMRWLEFAFILQEDMAAPNWARGIKWRIEDWENVVWLDKETNKQDSNTERFIWIKTLKLSSEKALVIGFCVAHKGKGKDD